MIYNKVFQNSFLLRRVKNFSSFNQKYLFSNEKKPNNHQLNILLISGSLRKKSTNTGLLRACV
jgi:hypothetical protein